MNNNTHGFLVTVLAEFFIDQFDNDHIGVSEWFDAHEGCWDAARFRMGLGQFRAVWINANPNVHWACGVLTQITDHSTRLLVDFFLDAMTGDEFSVCDWLME